MFVIKWVVMSSMLTLTEKASDPPPNRDVKGSCPPGYIRGAVFLYSSLFVRLGENLFCSVAKYVKIAQYDSDGTPFAIS